MGGTSRLWCIDDLQEDLNIKTQKRPSIRDVKTSADEEDGGPNKKPKGKKGTQRKKLLSFWRGTGKAPKQRVFERKGNTESPG